LRAETGVAHPNFNCVDSVLLGFYTASQSMKSGLSVKKRELRFFETSVIIDLSSRHNILEDFDNQYHRRKNLKSLGENV
jgi:hypothetical protein